MRFFNTAGPVRSADHYCIPPLERLDLDEILLLIRQQKYFVLHAPRQTGKTSALLALMDELNGSGGYRCAYVNVEVGQAAREDVNAAMRAVLSHLASRARTMLRDRFVESVWTGILEKAGPHAGFQEVLSRWAEASEEPLVLLLDEIDSLVGDTLVSLLRQLRAGYDLRPARFPLSVILCGVRDVRDYRIQSSRGKAIVTGGSAFNIKAESLRLGDFSHPEVRALYAQHSGETGQVCTEEALDEIWSLTRGQPWLVNALGYEACFRSKVGRDRSRPLTLHAAREACERLIARRETHLDQLADKLQEERVQRVIEPLLSGRQAIEAIPSDDLDYARDLGLVRRDDPIRIANPIYREIIPRELTYTTEAGLDQETSWYVAPDGGLLIAKLLAAFQEFFREHSEHWVERFRYREAGPQLLLQAFLQRIVNAGGRIEREYGLGRMRTDLLVVWPRDGATRKVVIECKLLHKSLRHTLREGLEQTRAYVDRCAADEGHLVVFDRSADKSWDEKVFRREEAVRGMQITVWGM